MIDSLSIAFPHLFHVRSALIKPVWFFLFLIPACGSLCHAEELNGQDLNTFSLYVENDYFAHKDSGYSSGIKLTWSSAVTDQYPQNVWPHQWLYPLIKHFPFENNPDREKNITFALGQNIYTPENIESEEIVKDDRPYAGITYLSLGFHSRLDRHMDTVEISLGLVGPSSYAEECQKAVHHIFDDLDPKGWDNQLSNEPVLELMYEHKKKLSRSGGGSGFGHDLILNTGGGLGNALIYCNLGLGFRFGWNLPNDFGRFPIRTISSFNGAFTSGNSESSENSPLGIQMIFSGEGRGVLHNIFLDGNTFTDSPSVNKKPVVGDFMAGINLSKGRAQLCVAFVFRSKEYETQTQAQKFGSINFSFSY